MVWDEDVVEDVEAVISGRDISIQKSFARDGDSAGTAPLAGSHLLPDNGHHILKISVASLKFEFLGDLVDRHPLDGVHVSIIGKPVGVFLGDSEFHQTLFRGTFDCHMRPPTRQKPWA